MQVGILHQMWSVADMSDRECVDAAVSDTQLAEELGFESMWFGEHHFGSTRPFYGRIPVPELLIARIAPETDRIRLGTGIKVLTTTDPVRCAEEMSLVDLLSGQRAMFGVGSGTTTLPIGLPEEDAKAGMEPEVRTSRFRTNLERLVELLAESDDGRPPVTPRPADDLVRRVWVGSRTPGTMAFAASLGVNAVCGQAESGDAQSIYTSAYRAAGGVGEVRGVRLTYVAETDAIAIAEVEKAATAYFRVLQRNASNGIGQEEPESIEEMLERAHYVVGSPDTVLAGLIDYRDKIGADHIDLLLHIPGLDRAGIHRSMRLFAEEVAPRLAA